MKTIKELVSDNKIARFSHAISAILYYNIEVDGETYQFPIDMNDKDDVGAATFEANIKAITLMRYIRKAFNDDTLYQIK